MGDGGFSDSSSRGCTSVIPELGGERADGLNLEVQERSKVTHHHVDTGLFPLRDTELGRSIGKAMDDEQRAFYDIGSVASNDGSDRDSEFDTGKYFVQIHISTHNTSLRIKPKMKEKLVQKHLSNTLLIHILRSLRN